MKREIIMTTAACNCQPFVLFSQPTLTIRQLLDHSYYNFLKMSHIIFIQNKCYIYYKV